jgi:Na+/H+-dicarboxylate symporter
MSSSSSSGAAGAAAAAAASKPPSRNPLTRLSFGVQILIGLLAGFVLGFVARWTGAAWLGSTLEQVGSVFVKLLFLTVPPLVFAALVVSITNLRGVVGAARLAGKTLLWFAITAFIAVSIGIALGAVTNPGSSFGAKAAGIATDPAAQDTIAQIKDHSGSWIDFLNGLIPRNPMDAFSSVNGKVLQIVFLGIVVGIAAIKVGKKAEPFINFTKSLLAITQKALWWVIRLSPLGVLGLIGKSVSQYGWDLLAPLATFTIDVYIGCAIVLFVVYPILLSAVAKVNPLKFFAGAWPALQLAFVSRSSVGTMPVTEAVTKRLGVPSAYASFAVPLGATTKLDGCAGVYPALGAIFVANAYGVHLGFKEYLLIVICSVIGSSATAGLTGALVMLTLTLTTVGLPLEGVALLLAIDPILDMMRTMTNVAGQAVVPVLVAASEKSLDREKFETAGGAEFSISDIVDGTVDAKDESELQPA